MPTPDEIARAQVVFAALAADPAVWATHGMPSLEKEHHIVAAIAAALTRRTPGVATDRDGADEDADLGLLCR